MRLGLGSVRGIGDELAKEIERGAAVRATGGPRPPGAGAEPGQLEAMATGGLFGECFGLERREALWAVGAVAQSRPDRLAGMVTGADGAAAARHVAGRGGCRRPVGHRHRPRRPPDAVPAAPARRAGVVTSQGLWDVTPGSRVTVAGVVTHRQRPMTAQGTTFLNLEDETGLINVVVSKGCWARFRRVAREAPAMTIRGRLERAEGVINLVADHLEPLTLPGSPSTPAGTSGDDPSECGCAASTHRALRRHEHSDAVDFGSRRSSGRCPPTERMRTCPST